MFNSDQDDSLNMSDKRALTYKNVQLMRKEDGIIWPIKPFGNLSQVLGFNAPRDTIVTHNYVIKPDCVSPPCRIILRQDDRLLHQSTQQNFPLEEFVKQNAASLIALGRRLKTVTTLVGKISSFTSPRHFIVYYTMQDNIADVSPNCILNYDTPCLMPAECTDIVRVVTRNKEVLCDSIPRAWRPELDLIALPTYSDVLAEAVVWAPVVEVLGFRMFKDVDPWKMM